jgi:hypothetical protein
MTSTYFIFPSLYLSFLYLYSWSIDLFMFYFSLPCLSLLFPVIAVPVLLHPTPCLSYYNLSHYAVLITAAARCIMNMLTHNNASSPLMVQRSWFWRPEDILIWQIYLASRRRLISSGDEFTSRLALSGSVLHQKDPVLSPCRAPKRKVTDRSSQKCKQVTSLNSCKGLVIMMDFPFFFFSSSVPDRYQDRRYL